MVGQPVSQGQRLPLRCDMLADQTFDLLLAEEGQHTLRQLPRHKLGSADPDDV
ncbi:hypothetical protein D3C87_1168010 [compost metagenome]